MLSISSTKLALPPSLVAPNVIFRRNALGSDFPGLIVIIPAVPESQSSSA
ncbi:12066_t:CDS:1, partial [Ambispora leptoticha]